MPDEPVLPAHAQLDRLDIRYQRRSFTTTIEKGAASVAPLVREPTP